MIRFTFFDGDKNWKDYNGTFLSQKLDNCGEFTYWLAIKVNNLIDAIGEKEAKKYGTYNVQLVSVSPQQTVPELPAALRYCEMEDTDLDTLPELEKVGVLLAYGIYAVLWNKQGNNIKKLMKEARKQAQLTQVCYGLMMDRPVNALGASGWEAQQGILIPQLEGKN